jgi:tetratricopeptide (TPR) repeat protein
MSMRSAYELHQAGRYADAARIYQTLLDRAPNDPDVLHLFGVMHHQCGYSARAAELTGRAVALRPDVAAYRANLADLALHRKQLQSFWTTVVTRSREALAHWQKDTALAGIRDTAALAKLPAEEQKAFAQLWSEVAALLKKDKPEKTLEKKQSS